MVFDLHTHSVYSDGDLTPEALVALAADQGVDVLSLSDHDSIQGVRQAVQAGERLGVKVIPGIEFSAKSAGEVHILGYNIHVDDVRINEMLAHLSADRIARVDRVLALLSEHGCHITRAELPVTGTVGRMHIAKEMVRRGFVRSISQAFEQYLKIGACCYVRGFKYTPEEIITAISDAGGVAVLAHPKQLQLDRTTLTQFVDTLCAWGLGGLEVCYPGHYHRDRAFLLELCRQRGLIHTCGTDFHGKMKNDILPGATSRDYRPDEETLIKLGIKK